MKRLLSELFHWRPTEKSSRRATNNKPRSKWAWLIAAQAVARARGSLAQLV